MNRTSHTDEPYEGEVEGLNQSPRALSGDLTTNQDLNGIANKRTFRAGASEIYLKDTGQACNNHDDQDPKRPSQNVGQSGLTGDTPGQPNEGGTERNSCSSNLPPSAPSNTRRGRSESEDGDVPLGLRLKNGVVKFCSFIGPGFMIAVAYIDPGNYSTGVAAGATYQFRLLFVVLVANLFAVFLQILCIKLGTVSGLNLAQACRAFLPRWMNYGLYFFAEVAIIATDIAEVIGFAIGLNLLIPEIPLVAGCAISILDVMLLLLFYKPHGSMRGLRIFEVFIMILVIGVFICFCIQLSLVKDTSIGKVFRGYLPSKAITESQGLYQACGILGATVMPHSLYLGSGIVQPRLRSYDLKHGLMPQHPNEQEDNDSSAEKEHYIPSAEAIKHSYKTSALELAVALVTFALFVNSAIVIVSGASLYNDPDAPDADIFSIHRLLSKSISPAAGTIFALALLLSGTSAGIVCTISGQMVCEGALNWKLRPWLRRLVTRSISIIPSIVIAAAVGRSGLSEALNASQVVLSVVLPFVTAPLIYFTCRKKYMTVGSETPQLSGVHAAGSRERDLVSAAERTSMSNSWYTTSFAVLLWLVITVLNGANLVLLALGK